MTSPSPPATTGKLHKDHTMRVGELKRMLERYDDNDLVEFEDRTKGRICPTNSSYSTEHNGLKVVRICNTLGSHRA